LVHRSTAVMQLQLFLLPYQMVVIQTHSNKEKIKDDYTN
jgi:hypothetical protein